jgi:DNA-binding protein HU-beta
MNKTELAKKLASKAGLSEAKAAEVVAAIFGTGSGKGIIATELDAGGKVTIAGFGTFEARRRAGRPGRNPATGQQISIPARSVARFRPAPGLHRVAALPGDDDGGQEP